MGDSQSDGHLTNIGQRIRMLRQQRGLSQRELAAASSLSPNTLSLVEREQSSPTASTLQKLAAALGISISAFFEPEPAANSAVYTRAGQRPQLRIAHGYAADLGLVGQSQALVTPLVVTLELGAHSGPPMTHAGQEFAYCLSGQLLYAIESQVFLLEPGDSLLFDATHSHRWQNAGASSVEALVVLCMAEEGLNAFSPHIGTPEPEG